MTDRASNEAATPSHQIVIRKFESGRWVILGFRPDGTTGAVKAGGAGDVALVMALSDALSLNVGGEGKEEESIAYDDDGFPFAEAAPEPEDTWAQDWSRDLARALRGLVTALACNDQSAIRAAVEIAMDELCGGLGADIDQPQPQPMEGLQP